MNEEKTNAAAQVDDENQSSRDAKKRVSYVSKDLKAIIEFVSKIYNVLGHTAFHSNKAIATVHGLSPDSIKLHLSSAQQYKLLELKHAVGYKVTDHFQKLYLPRNESEKREAVIESLKHADTYQQLFKDYEYHVVAPEGVKNHFIRSFGLKEDIAQRAANIFLENLKDFELLDTRNVLTSGMPSKPIVPEVTPEHLDSKNDNKGSGLTDDEIPAKNHPPAVIPINDFTENKKYQDHIWIPIHVTKGETAVFAYPKDITENDIKIVEHQLAGILLRIRLENEEKNKGDKSPS